MPGFLLWTILGTVWLREVMMTMPDCVPTPTHLYFSGVWLFLCYIWIILHASVGGIAFVLERRVRKVESSIREIEDDEVRRRWGEISHVPNFQELDNAIAKVGAGGLPPAEIKLLPCEVVLAHEDGSTNAPPCECSICIGEFEVGSSFRRLPACGHTFHKGCIDVWLLRQSSCPLCKKELRCGRWV